MFHNQNGSSDSGSALNSSIHGIHLHALCGPACILTRKRRCLRALEPDGVRPFQGNSAWLAFCCRLYPLRHHTPRHWVSVESLLSVTWQPGPSCHLACAILGCPVIVEGASGLCMFKTLRKGFRYVAIIESHAGEPYVVLGNGQ